MYLSWSNVCLPCSAPERSAFPSHPQEASSVQTRTADAMGWAATLPAAGTELKLQTVRFLAMHAFFAVDPKKAKKVCFDSDVDKHIVGSFQPPETAICFTAILARTSLTLAGLALAATLISFFAPSSPRQCLATLQKTLT